MYSLDNQLTISDLIPNHHTYGINQGSQDRNWIAVIILCSKFIHDKHLTKMLIVAEQYLRNETGNIFNILLTNADIYSPFQ